MPDIADDPIATLALNIQGQKGVYALLLGSGVSVAAGIPSGRKIISDLVEQLATKQGVPLQSDWIGWYTQEYRRKPDYSDLLERVAPKPAERLAFIQKFLSPQRDLSNPNDRTGLPTRAHQAIARLVKDGYIRVIITTNFDRLLERALMEIGVQPTVIASPDDCKGAVDPVHSPCTILKLHGDLQDIRARNTKAELDQYPRSIGSLLKRILRGYGLIVCGWSAEWDPALCAAIQRTSNRRYSTWWTAYRGEMKPEAKVLADHRRAERISITGADGFFQELEVKVETLTRLKKPPPATTALVVAMAKRYLQRPEHRIDLADLVQRETDRLLDRVKEILPQARPTRPDPMLAQCRDQCEVAVETLASVLGTIGRWGNDDPAAQQLGLAPDAILRCLALWRDPSDPSRPHYLAAYPPLFLFHAYGLGLVQARRLQALWEFLTLPLGKRSDWRSIDSAEGPLRMVEAFLLQWWLPLQINRNRSYAEDLSGVRLDDSVLSAPVTDHVRARLGQCEAHFMGDVADRKILNERFLMFAAYALFASRPELIKDGKYQTAGVGVAVPHMRMGSFRLLLEELREAANVGNIFGPREPALFEAFKSNLRVAGGLNFAF